MKFLLDENIPIETLEVIGRLGYDVKSVYELGLAGKNDESVLKVAKKQKRILITLDIDFANILHYPPKMHEGIIVVRILNFSKQKLIQKIEQFLKSIKQIKISKTLVILQDENYRIRK